jgi:hypothetical protein
VGDKRDQSLRLITKPLRISEKRENDNHGCANHVVIKIVFENAELNQDSCQPVHRSLLWFFLLAPAQWRSNPPLAGLVKQIRALLRAAIDGAPNSALVTASEHDGSQKRMVVERIGKLCDAVSGLLSLPVFEQGVN